MTFDEMVNELYKDMLVYGHIQPEYGHEGDELVVSWDVPRSCLGPPGKKIMKSKITGIFKDILEKLRTGELTIEKKK